MQLINSKMTENTEKNIKCGGGHLKIHIRKPIK